MKNYSGFSDLAVGLSIAAGAALGVGLGLFCLRPGGRRSRPAEDTMPSLDTGAMLAALLDRLDPIEAGLGAIQARLNPLQASVANLKSDLQKQSEDIEALKLCLNDAQQKEQDTEIARLGALLVEMNHPLRAASSELTH